MTGMAPPYQSEIWYGSTIRIWWNLDSWFAGKII